MEPQNQLTSRLVDMSPEIIIGVVTALTLIRWVLVKTREAWARQVCEMCDSVNFILILAFLLLRPFVAQAFYIPSQSMTNTLLVNDRLIVDKVSYRLKEPHRGDVVVFEAPLTATGGIENEDYIKRLIGMPGDTIQVKQAQLIIDGKPFDPHSQGAPDTHTYLRRMLGLGVDAALKLYPDHVYAGGRSYTREEVAALLGHQGANLIIQPGETIRNGKVLDEPYTREDPDYDYPDDGRDEPLKLGDDELFMMGDNRNNSADSHAWGPLPREKVVGHAVVLFWPLNRAGKIR